jgi:ABC-type Zn uptake system ZnuABC Zn-binding protein ZnuA
MQLHNQNLLISNKFRKFSLLFILVLIVQLQSSSLGKSLPHQPDSSVQEENLFQIVTTIAIPYEIATAIAGDHANIVSIVDSATDVHSFDGPTIRQIQAMLDADVIFSIGIAGSEPWLANIVEDNPSLADLIVPLANIVEDGYADPLLDGEINPHVWMSPHTVKSMANITTAALVQLDPSNGGDYMERNTTYQIRLDTLLENIAGNRTTSFQGLKVVVNHPAYLYLFDLLGIERLRAIELHSGGEPGQATINEIIQTMEAENCSLIVTDPQHSVANAEEIARATGAQIAEMSAIPGIYPNFVVPDYISMIEYCMDSLLHPVEVPAESIPGFTLFGIVGFSGIVALILQNKIKSTMRFLK